MKKLIGAICLVVLCATMAFAQHGYRRGSGYDEGDLDGRLTLED